MLLSLTGMLVYVAFIYKSVLFWKNKSKEALHMCAVLWCILPVIALFRNWNALAYGSENIWGAVGGAILWIVIGFPLSMALAWILERITALLISVAKSMFYAYDKLPSHSNGNDLVGQNDWAVEADKEPNNPTKDGNYKGTQILRVGDQFVIGVRRFDTLQEAQRYVDESRR